MRLPLWTVVTLLLVAALSPIIVAADDPSGPGWIDLSRLATWRGGTSGWSTVGDVKLDVKDPKQLAAERGTGVICNGPVGRAPNIMTTQEFGDVQIQLEFFLPKGSNSGIKFQEVYEIQLFDSHGVKQPKGTDSGGVYPRSEDKPKYHHIDGGHPPMVNAALPAGQWQTLDATFIAPKFDGEGKKIADARITALLNGRKVQDDLRVTSPTGSAYRNQEKLTGSILLQADHGPVAFRKIRARAVDPTTNAP